MAQFYYRVEFGEAKLVGNCRRDAFDAAVVQARYIAPAPEGDQREPAELLAALKACGAPWLIDLCTPQLCEPNVLLVDGYARLRASAMGRLLPLPLDPSRLENDEARDAFVDACASFQADAPVISAPYLEFDREDDLRLEANLAMLRRIVGAAGDRPAVGFLQVTLDSFNHGLAARVARRYAETGVTVVFLRVRSFKAESATEKHVRAYQTTVDAFTAAKIGIVADQVGRFGAVAVGCGAIGFSSGTQHFRSVPRQPVPLGGGGGGPKLAVELPGRWVTAPRDQLSETVDCPVPGCAVANGDRTLDALREHDLHYQRYLAAELGPDIPALIADLRASGQAQALAWAAELERQARRSA